MKYRKPPRNILLIWLLMAVILVAGLLIGFTVSRPAGIVLFIIGCAGYIIGGLIIFIIIPRRHSI